mmetsp:Transcript_1402/g.2909  ORF Transcript_1402/g.2909 Transcript_1402/m.2909 type:complete len:1285 (-) Transcript_1402:132-3986(-)
MKPINVMFYSLNGSSDIDEKRPHLRKDLNIFTHYEIGNLEHTKGGITQIYIDKINKRASVLSTVEDKESGAEIATVVETSEEIMVGAGTECVVDDDEDVEDLNGGMYLRNGDVISMSQAGQGGGGDIDSFGADVCVTDGGGFAILQEDQVNIKISKALLSNRQSKKRESNESNFIRSGDFVTISLVGQDPSAADGDTKFLSTHRGWFLKWVNNISKNNGVFIIQCVEDTDSMNTVFESGETIIMDDSVRQLVAIGSPFILRHRKWDDFIIGVRDESSAKFGGRLLALLNSSHYNSNEIGDGSRVSDPSNPWVKPLVLCAHLAPCGGLPSPKRIAAANNVAAFSAQDSDDLNYRQIPENCIVDITGWIEMVDRRKRKRQLAYVVRCRTKIPQDADNTDDENTNIAQEHSSFFTLRTGMELAPIVQQWRSSTGFSSLRSAVTSQLHTKGTNSYDLNDGESDDDDDQNMDLASDDSGESDSDSGGSVHSDDVIPIVPSHFEETNRIDLVHPSPSIANSQSFETKSSYQQSPKKKTLKFNFDEIVEDGIKISDASQPRPSKTVKGRVARKTKTFTVFKRSKALPNQKGGPQGHNSETTAISNNNNLDVLSPGNHNYQGQEIAVVSLLNNAEILDGGGALTGEGNNDENSIDILENLDPADVGNDIPSENYGSTKIKSKLRSVATTVKDGTTKTTKNVAKTVMNGTISTSKGIVKGAKIAGRAASRVAPSQRPRGRPPAREPRQLLKAGYVKGLKSKNNKSNCKVVKRMHKINLPARSYFKPTAQRSTKEKIMKNYSAILHDSIHRNETTAGPLRSTLSTITDLDSWFLKGGSADIGVMAAPPIALYGGSDPLFGAVCARALHRNSWREEWCGIYPQHISFYPHFSKKPDRILLHRDIISVRRLDKVPMCHPMPGLHMLAIDTLGRVYYVAFGKHSVQENCFKTLQSAIFSACDTSTYNSINEYDPIPTHDPQESFLLKSERWARMQTNSGSKTHARLILNARRINFFDDVDFLKRRNSSPEDEEEMHLRICKFMESTLHLGLALRPDSPLRSTISFLDMTCNFSSIPLHKLGDGDMALCFFINLYHCLLQHILLLLGPPSKSTISSRMRLFCYEVGDDVFSLSDIESYVIRGKLSRPTYSKAPFVSGIKPHPSNGLSAADYRVNFVLNHGFAINPSTVPVLISSSLDAQLNHASAIFLDQVSVDYKKRTIYLPKICDIYRNDFGDGDLLTLAKYCLSFVRVNWEAVNELLLNEEAKPIVKFLPLSLDYHSHLQELCEDNMAFRCFSET